MAGLPPSQQGSTHSLTPALSQQSTLVGGNSPSPHVSSQALNRAITKFCNRLSGSDLQNVRNTTYAQLCKEIERIQNEQKARADMRNLGRIKSFLEAMEQLSKVIEVFLNVSDVVAFVWGPMKLLLLVIALNEYLGRQGTNLQLE